MADRFVVDGLIITDSDYYATAWFDNSTLNNVKIIGWNGNNDGIQMGMTVSVSNVFIRTGDDSLKMWGSSITVTNTTVWQGWNGGVINLGWADNSPGDDCLIDGVYVVETDWSSPNAPSWTSTTLNADNDAIIASLMAPGTSFGTVIPSVYRNICVEDTPRVLFSLKILPPDCNLNGQVSCPPLNPSLPGVLNLNIENVFSPVSKLENSIGFQTVNGTPLIGRMNIGLVNVMLTQPNGSVTALSTANATTVGDITTNGGTIDVTYPGTPTQMLLSATPNPVASGQAVTLAASVSPSTATGTVSFFDGTTQLGTATLSAGTATLAVKNLTAGAHVLAASYSGNTAYGPSLAASVDVTVAVAPTISLVANAEGESPTIAPNTWVEIKGTNLAPAGDSRIWQGSDFVNNQMPTSLDGVSATVNGNKAYVYYISPTQINILTPPNAVGGPVQVVVTNGGTAGAAFTAQEQTISPSFFVFNGGPYVTATHADGNLIGPATLYPGASTPAKPGETVVLYANGFGPTNVPLQSGSIMQSGTLSPSPIIKIGGITATVQFAGLVAPGEFQFNVVIPASLTNGDQSIAATYGGVSTQSGALITVQY